MQVSGAFRRQKPAFGRLKAPFLIFFLKYLAAIAAKYCAKEDVNQSAAGAASPEMGKGSNFWKCWFLAPDGAKNQHFLGGMLICAHCCLAAPTYAESPKKSRIF